MSAASNDPREGGHVSSIESVVSLGGVKEGELERATMHEGALLLSIIIFPTAFAMRSSLSSNLSVT